MGFDWLKDQDGSRNDIGLWGGPAYDPAALAEALAGVAPGSLTHNKPITLVNRSEPAQIVRGTGTNSFLIKSVGIKPLNN